MAVRTETRVLEQINLHRDDYPPTYRQIANELGMPNSTVLSAVQRLRIKDLVRYDNGAARTMRPRHPKWYE